MIFVLEKIFIYRYSFKQLIYNLEGVLRNGVSTVRFLFKFNANDLLHLRVPQPSFSQFNHWIDRTDFRWTKKLENNQRKRCFSTSSSSLFV